METKTLTQSDLNQFTGTENWYRNFLGVLYTDGVKFVAETAGAYWLIDAIASHIKTNPKLRKGRLGDLQFWNLTVNGREGVVTQEMGFTDFPLESIDIWVGNACSTPTIYLPSEH